MSLLRASPATPCESLAELDAAVAHAAAGYRDAVGDSGRRQMNEMNHNCVEMTQTMHFRLRPEMSALPKEWAATDAYGAPGGRDRRRGTSQEEVARHGRPGPVRPGRPTRRALAPS